MNVFKIAFSNVRKRKAAAITFFVMVMLAAVMLSVSMNIIIGMNDFYEKKVDELNAPHYASLIDADHYSDGMLEYAEGYQGVTDTSVQSVLIVSSSAWKLDGGDINSSVAFYRESDTDGVFYDPPLIDEKDAAGRFVILPISFKNRGLRAGDGITVEITGELHEFFIKAFFEDALTGPSTFGMSSVYIDDASFEAFSADMNFNVGVALFARFRDPEMSRGFLTAFNRDIGLDIAVMNAFTFQATESQATLFIGIMSMLLLVFSFIMLLIAFVVVIFSISSQLSEDIKTVGTLKSLGYRNRVLRGSQFAQYLTIAVLGSLIGGITAIFGFGLLGPVISSTSGLLWIAGVNAVPLVVSVAVITGLSALIIFLATGKYAKVTPVNALRDDAISDSRKKNALPLERTKMPLDIQLGFKRFLGTVKNNIVLFVVVTLLVFVSSIVYVMKYNMNDNRTAMIKMVGLEMASIWVQPVPDADIDGINADIMSDTENVERTMLHGTKRCFFGETESFITACEDYDSLLINAVIKGRYPKAADEITLANVTSKFTGKDIGDNVTITIDGVDKDYRVVGISQNIANGGEGCEITFEGMTEHCPDFSPDTIYVYLRDGVDSAEYEDAIKTAYGNQILTANTGEQMDTILSSMATPVAQISWIMIAVTVLVIAFVLFLIISALIRKQKKEFGIMKAIGYTGKRLILQLILSFLPSIFLGCVLGAVLNIVLANALLSLAFGAAGLLKTYFIISPAPMIVIAFSLFAVSVLSAVIMSLRVRSISPERLIRA